MSLKEACHILLEVFAEYSPPCELLYDNGTVFCSTEVRQLLNNWRVQLRFLRAYHPQGNGL